VPIYDRTYRRHEARGPLRAVRFWPITREALRLVLARRAFLLLLVAAWCPFLVRLVQIYLVTRLPQAGQLLPVDGRLFGEFLNQQLGFTLLLSIFGGAGLIAGDLGTGAILVYLSRPLTRRDYVLGKLGAVLALNLGVTLAPALLLYLVGLALAPELLAQWSLAWIGPAIVLHSLLLALVVSLVALAVSSLCRNVRVAGLGLALLFIGLEIARGVLENIFAAREAELLSLQANLRAMGSVLFGVAARGAQAPWGYSAAVLAAVSAGCLAILRWRVRAVEIVR